MRIEIHFLTDDPSKVAVCRDYWAHDGRKFTFSVKEIGRNYGLQTSRVATDVEKWCQAYSPDDTCSQCHKMSRVYRNRTEYAQAELAPSNWICHECQEANKRQEQAATQEKYAQVRQHFSNETQGIICFEDDASVPPNSLEQVIAFLGIVRLGATEQLEYIRPAIDYAQLLAPTNSYESELIKSVINGRVLVPNIDLSPIDAFRFSDGVFSGAYYYYYTAWKLPIALRSSRNENNDQALFYLPDLEQNLLKMSWPNVWNEQWIPLWRRISLEECLQYLDVCMKDHAFEFQPGAKTRQVISTALESFSVAQMYTFIWRATKDAAAYYVRERIPKNQAANSVVGNIQRQVEKALSERWEVKGYRRDRRCPQTIMSRILFDVVLHIGNEGFEAPPGHS